MSISLEYISLISIVFNSFNSSRLGLLLLNDMLISEDDNIETSLLIDLEALEELVEFHISLILNKKLM